MTNYVTLDGYEVKAQTTRAIGLAKAKNPDDDLTWIPRSLCENGDDLGIGETDISVAEWKAEQEGLDY